MTHTLLVQDHPLLHLRTHRIWAMILPHGFLLASLVLTQLQTLPREDMEMPLSEILSEMTAATPSPSLFLDDR
jgi:hypothetical protein